MDPKDKMEEFKRISQFMRDTLKEVDGLLIQQFTYQVCGHCLEATVCAPAYGIPERWRINLCERCNDAAIDGWLIIE